MNLKEINDDYDLYKKIYKLEKSNYFNMLFWFIFLLLYIFFLIYIISYKYLKIDSYLGTVIFDKGEYYVEIYVNEDDINDFSNQNLNINRKQYSYRIISTSVDEYIDNNEIYRKIKLYINDYNYYNLENNMIILNFKNKKTSIINNVINEIKEGVRW